MTWAVFIENGTYSCTCKAANKPACVHRAAVYLAKVQATGAKVVSVRPAKRQPKQGAAPVALATFRVNGRTFTGTGRNVLNALGNAQAAA